MNKVDDSHPKSPSPYPFLVVALAAVSSVVVRVAVVLLGSLFLCVLVHIASSFLVLAHLDCAGHSVEVVVSRIVHAVSFLPWCALPHALLLGLHLFW